MTARTISLTTIALIAFAANSVLCRLALQAELIDPVSFTAVRIISGALALTPIMFINAGGEALPRTAASWVDVGAGSAALFVYVLAFSLSYVSLDAGVGALILFGTVQVTMLAYNTARGMRLSALQWAGAAAALGGLAYLVAPGAQAPPVWGALAMMVSGIAWGAYSLLGRGAERPTLATGRNFILAAVYAGVLIAAVPVDWSAVEPSGLALAIASGAITSGLGYVIWYAALPRLEPALAATAQLSVPAIAAAGGTLFIDEPITLRLALAGLIVLGGILAVIRGGASTQSQKR